VDFLGSGSLRVVYEEQVIDISCVEYDALLIK
jgi:hypothetical protein